MKKLCLWISFGFLFISIFFAEILNTDSITSMTDIDGNVYKTVKIGNQWWMAEDLRVTHYRNGDPIPHVMDDLQWENLSTGAYCYYKNSISSISIYGLLYNWFAVNDSRNIAPEGWHVPTDDEWKELEMYLGMNQNESNNTGIRGTDEGGKLKVIGTTHWDSPNIGATNSNGFSAFPGGYRNANGVFCEVGLSAFYWTATEYYTYLAWHRSLGFSCSGIFRNTYGKLDGFSVRLVKN